MDGPCLDFLTNYMLTMYSEQYINIFNIFGFNVHSCLVSKLTVANMSRL